MPTEDDDEVELSEPVAIRGPDQPSLVSSEVAQPRGSPVTAQTSEQQTRNLLERFVDLEQPVITEKMTQFIMDPGMF